MIPFNPGVCLHCKSCQRYRHGDISAQGAFSYFHASKPRGHRATLVCGWAVSGCDAQQWLLHICTAVGFTGCCHL